MAEVYLIPIPILHLSLSLFAHAIAFGLMLASVVGLNVLRPCHGILQPRLKLVVWHLAGEDKSLVTLIDRLADHHLIDKGALAAGINAGDDIYRA